jgi:DNA-binding NtrC family response regulator
MSKFDREARILVVDDEERIRTILGAILKDNGYQVETASDGLEAITKCKQFSPQLAIVDLKMPRMDGLETIQRIREIDSRIVSIILTAHGTIQSAVQAIKQGVYDYLTKPFDNEQMLLVIARAIEYYRLTTEVDHLKSELQRKHGLEAIMGDSRVMQEVRAHIKRIADTDATVLIEGESGTGKELAARAIHYESKRKNNPFVIFDCGAIPLNLTESELFGHERGAFTDAREQRIGKFEEAHTGSIFLDEISELPLDAQTKLLRILQEKEFCRIGGNTPVKSDVRVIAATNRNLEQLMQDGRFREDLYYRLEVLKLRIPPLREHREDIPIYLKHFLMKHRQTIGKNVTAISDDALIVLRSREWKGNIRELENAVQRAMLSATGTCIEVTDLDFLTGTGDSIMLENDEKSGLDNHIRSLTERAERELILKALQEAGWNRTEAARKLKISRKTLFNKMHQYNIGTKAGS